MKNVFGKTWFHATDGPSAIQWLHDNLVQHVHEYHWRKVVVSEAGTENEMHGWFRPLNLHTAEAFVAAVPGVTLLPPLLDPSPVSPAIVTLLAYANVTATDNGFSVARKLHQYHIDKHGGDYPEMRPSLY